MPNANKSLTPLPHMRPCIRISPFSSFQWNQALQGNRRDARFTDPQYWLNDAQHIQWLESGRNAIHAALLNLKLKRSDEVYIVKTTNGPYISSCITQTIEKVCRWSQKISPNTKLIFAIHEFGFPLANDQVRSLQKLNLPILEDCAYAFGSRQEGANVGTFGDFAIYSLPKHFPFPFGGVLTSKKKLKSSTLNLNNIEKNLLLKGLSNTLPEQKIWNRNRQQNWKFFSQYFKPYFSISPKIVPGIFLLKTNLNFKGEIVKKNLNTAGVESTQYYHQGGFYFPVHQFLTPYDKDYILNYARYA